MLFVLFRRNWWINAILSYLANQTTHAKLPESIATLNKVLGSPHEYHVLHLVSLEELSIGLCLLFFYGGFVFICFAILQSQLKLLIRHKKYNEK